MFRFQFAKFAFYGKHQHIIFGRFIVDSELQMISWIQSALFISTSFECIFEFIRKFGENNNKNNNNIFRWIKCVNCQPFHKFLSLFAKKKSTNRMNIIFPFATKSWFFIWIEKSLKSIRDRLLVYFRWKWLTVTNPKQSNRSLFAIHPLK